MIVAEGYDMLGLSEATAFAIIAASAQPVQMNPLHLQVEQRGTTTILRVVGSADQPCAVAYNLQVTDGSNRSAQHGMAHLEAGRPVTVASIRLNTKQRLSATLSVKSSSTAYEETFQSR